VDREERPDIDQIYMTVCQLMTGRGGWPLTIMMTADRRPFFAATYIPKVGRFGQIGLIELIREIRDRWNNRRKDLLINAERITNHLVQFQRDDKGNEQLDKATLREAYEALDNIFDLQNGGFGIAPKFPTPHNLLFLLRYWRRSGAANALEMVETTLKAMSLGGIYDHVGFGFHRYSTDPQWIVPHFEKMLYDQALLILAYTEAYQATAKKEYALIAHQILEYILRDMTSPEGGFYSAEDADSEGEEGKFYLWTMDELKWLLDEEEYSLFSKVFDIRSNGNFDKGRNILSMLSSLEDASTILGIPLEALQDSFERIRQKLFKFRTKRIHPLKDDKILAEWNGLMIAAMARASQVLGESKYADVASKAADFILKRMRSLDGRLLHRYRDCAGIIANLNDYAFMIWGMIELYEALFDPKYLNAALNLNKEMLDRFWDNIQGGLFFMPDDGETIIVRQKGTSDGALPSGNSVAMLNLLRLSHLTGNSELEEKAFDIARAFSRTINQQPLSHTMFMCALDFALGPSIEVVIVGNLEDAETLRMLKALRSKFVPNKAVLLVSGEEIYKVAHFTKGLAQLNGRSTAYVCAGYQCQLPTNEPNKMLELLEGMR
ncbi:MAG: thioredoxin domain-containing protein, partial [Methanotrichaceae archaeon]|nr:thioredoxin domain-containing protein [Methanotrichaceae archaeon]